MLELPGRLCILRPWRQSDAASLVKYADNPNVARQLRDRFPHPYTLGHARQFIRSVAEARPITMFAVVVGDEAAGGIGFTPGSDVERYTAEIGYWLAEPFWGRGITTEAVQLVSEYAFRTCNLLRLFAVPFADNVRSNRVLEKAGYLLEATLHASSVKNGEPRDQTLYALVNEKWRRP